jgi:hypothetical protein
MTIKWSKEDRAAWDNSEVAQELEKKVLSTIESLEAILKKSNITQSTNEVDKATNSMKELTEATDDANRAVETLSSAEDGVVEYDEESDEESEENAVENYADDGPSEMEVVARLRDLLKEATDKREIELAYKIERTIDEILEEE